MATELASGYVSLSVRYSSAMRQIARDVAGIEKVAKISGQKAGKNLSDSLETAAGKSEAATQRVNAALKSVEDQTGKVRVAEAQLQALRDRGIQDAGRLAAAEEKVAAAKRNLTQAERQHANAASAATAALERLNSAQRDGERNNRRLGSSFGDVSKSARNATDGIGSVGATAASASAKGVIGFTALLGVTTGVSSLISGPLVAALGAAAAAMGVAAASASGILGPALLSLGLGVKGVQDAVKAYSSSDGGVSQAKAVASASRQVEQAEKGVERAKRDSRNAERDLTRARKDALEQLEDMQLTLKGAALSEKDAQLSLLEARRDLMQLGSDGQPVDMLDRERAVLRVQEAEQRLAETQESNGDLAEKAADINAKGVEGSDEVVAAKERLADANQSVIDSEQQLTDAVQAVTDAQNQGQSGVDPFDLMIGQRMGPAIDAVKSLKQTVTDSLTTELQPAFGTFGTMVDGLKPKIAGLAGLFGVIGTNLINSLAGPAVQKSFDQMIAASNTFFAAFKDGKGLDGLTTGLASFAGTAAQTFAAFGTTVDGALGRLGDYLRNITPEQMTAAFVKLRQVFESIKNVVGPIFSALRQFASISAPALAPGFQAIGEALKQATPGVMAMARDLMPALGDALKNLAPILPSLVDSFRPMATILAVLAPAIATVVSHLGPLAPVIVGVLAAMKAWGLVMAGLSIAQGVFAAATGAGTLAIAGNTVAMVAYRVAMVAGAAITGVVTAAQWLLNAALDANPIGLVVLAIAALVAGLVVAYKNSETFRNIVNAAWNAIKVAIGAVWNWITDTVLPALKTAFEAIGDAAMWLWRNAIQPAWDGIKTAIGVAWDLIKGYFDLWKTAFTTVGDAAMWLWNNAITPAWEGIKGAFGSAWDFMSDIFTKLKNGFTTVKDVTVGIAKSIGDAFHTAFNGLTDLIKAPLHALGDFLAAIPTNVLGVDIPGAATVQGWGKSLQGLATGGVVRGPGTGTSDSILAWLSNGEGVVTAAAMAKGGAPLVAALNAGWVPPAQMLHEMLPGFADGGVAEAEQFAQQYGDGRRYVYGGTGPKGFDCSGFMSAIYGVMTGRDPYKRYFTTESDFASLGFVEGFQPGAFNIGIRRGGGGPNSHMAGTLPNGVNVESGGNDSTTKYGGSAHGAMDFPLKFHLPTQGNPTSGVTTPTTGSSGGSWSGAGSTSSSSTGASSPMSSGSGSAAGSTNPFTQIGAGLGQFTDLIKGGLKETLLPPGFSDPEEWGVTKLLSSLLKFGGGLAGAKSGVLSAAGDTKGAAGLGVLSSVLTAGSQIAGGQTGTGVSSLFSLLFSGPPAPDDPADSVGTTHQGTGALPGPADAGNAMTPDASANGSVVNNDNSIHVAENGQVGMDPVSVFDRTQRQQAAQQLPQLGTRRY